MDKVSGMRRTAKDMNPVDLGRGASYSNSYDQNDSDKPPSNSQIAFISAHALVGVLAIIALAIASAIATGSLPVGSLSADNIKEGDAPVQLATSSGSIDITARNNAASVEILSGSGGFRMETDGSMNLRGNATASQSLISHAGGPSGRDLTIESRFGSLVLSGGEADVADAVQIKTTSTTGGIDIDAGSRGIDISTTGLLHLRPTGTGSVNVNTPGGFEITSTSQTTSTISHTGAADNNNDLTIECTNGSLKLSGGESIVFDSSSTTTNSFEFTNNNPNTPLTSGNGLNLNITHEPPNSDTVDSKIVFFQGTNIGTENQNGYGLSIKYQKTGDTANNKTANIYGADIRVDDNGGNAGTVNVIGANIFAAGGTANTGLVINSEGMGLKMHSHDNVNDYFSITTAGEHGATIIGTEDAANGTGAHLTFNVDGTVKYNSPIEVGVDDTGYDVQFFGATAGASMLWDQSNDQLIIQTTAAGQNPNLILKNFNEDANGPILRFVKEDTNGQADNDSCGVISFHGVDNVNTATEFVKMEAKSTDITNDKKAGQLTFTLMTGGINDTSAATDMLRIGGEDSTSTPSVRGGLFTKAANYTSAQLGTNAAGWDQSEPTVNVSEHNGIVETIVFLDLGDANVVGENALKYVIAKNGTTNPAYFMKLQKEINGYIFNVSMTCVEALAPTDGTVTRDIDLVVNTDIINEGSEFDDGGASVTLITANANWELGVSLSSALNFGTGAAGLDNYYMYLAVGGTSNLHNQDAAYTAGQYIIRLLGVAPCKSNGQPLPT